MNDQQRGEFLASIYEVGPLDRIFFVDDILPNLWDHRSLELVVDAAHAGPVDHPILQAILDADIQDAQECETFLDGTTANERIEFYKHLYETNVLAKRTEITRVERLNRPVFAIHPNMLDDMKELLEEDKASLVIADYEFGTAPTLGNGADLLQELMDDERYHVKGAILMSSTFNDEKGEPINEYWTHYAKSKLDEAGISVNWNQVVALSRRHLDNSDAEITVSCLAHALFSPLFHQYQEEIQDRMVSALERAFVDVKDLSPISYHNINFGRAAKEGVWPPFLTMELILALTRQQFYTKQDFSKLPKLLLRQAITLKGRRFPGKILEHQQKSQREMHARKVFFGPALSQSRLPLANGDIFRAKGQEYILLCQPCDIQLRNTDGTKPPRSLGDPPVVPLVRIDAVPDGVSKPHSKPPWNKGCMLPVSGQQKHEDALRRYANFHEFHMVDVRILDLTVYDTQGRSLYPRASGKHWSPTLENHYRRISQKTFIPLRRKLNKYNRSKQSIEAMLGPNAGQLVDIAASIRDASNLPHGGLPMDVENTVDQLNFDVVRINRLDSELAAYLIDEFHRYHSRTGLEPPLSVGS